MSPVELSTTLDLFGYAQGFQVRAYIDKHIRNVNVSKAEEHRVKLQKHRELTSDELKRLVTQRYMEFIRTSKEVTHIESEMLLLSNMLGEYAGIIKSLKGVRFDCEPLLHSGSPRHTKHRNESQAILGTSDHPLVHHQHESPHETSAFSEPSIPTAEIEKIDDDIEMLSGLIYERKFAKANQKIQSLRKWVHEQRRSSLGQARGVQLHALTAKMIKALYTGLKQSGAEAPPKQREQRQMHACLIALGHARESRALFLAQGSRTIRSAIRDIVSRGDMRSYSHELAKVTFGGISQVCQEFLHLFLHTNNADPSLLSGVTVWCVDELGIFARLFCQQVFRISSPSSESPKFAHVVACLHDAMTGCRTLEKYGFSLAFVLSQMLIPSLVRSISSHFTDMSARLRRRIEVDTWELKTVMMCCDAQHAASSSDECNDGSKSSASGRASDSTLELSVASTTGVRIALKITESTRCVYSDMQDVIDQIVPVLNPKMLCEQADTRVHAAIVKGVTSVLEGFLTNMGRKGKAAEVSDGESLSIIANAFYLCTDLLPRIERAVCRHFGQCSGGLSSFGVKMKRLYEALQEDFCRRRALVWIRRHWKWCVDDMHETPSADFDSSATQQRPSSGAVEIARNFTRMSGSVRHALNEQMHTSTVKLCTEKLFKSLMSEPRNWNSIKFGNGRLHQFALDLHFLLHMLREFVTPKAKDSAEACMRQAVLAHCRQNNVNMDLSKSAFVLDSGCKVLPDLAKLKERVQAWCRENKFLAMT